VAHATADIGTRNYQVALLAGHHALAAERIPVTLTLKQGATITTVLV
jgi:hypothetical protein